MYPIINTYLPSFIPPPYLFLDLEYSGLKPTVLGVADSAGGYSVPWSSEAAAWLRPYLHELRYQIVGHAALTADAEILEAAMGIKVPWTRIVDTMIWHYLCNAELCKGVAKVQEEDDGESGPRDVRGEGFMDLWTMASLYTTLPNWKWPWNCKNPASCAGRPCPRHSTAWYNGLDALSLPLAWPNLDADARAKQIPQTLYDHVARLTLLCQRMTKKGIMVDEEKIREIMDLINREKDQLFPSHEETRYGKKGKALKHPALVWDAPFNPRSPKQVLDWFAEQGVFLGSTEREDIELALDSQADPEAAVCWWLHALYDYKTVGKGVEPWASGEYVESLPFSSSRGLLHPRFIPTASSLGRLASSHPNFQNIPAKGKLMRRIREAIIPRPGYKLVTADAKQLELRMCLWWAGAGVDLGSDAFRWLVAQAPETFEEAVKHINRAGWTARDTAKSVTHGGDYGEGMTLLKPSQLEQGRTKKMIDAGALVVCDWEYSGKIVAFTGTNLAKRLFGSASWENRKKANLVQEAIFSRFPAIRTWQRKVGEFIENRGFIRDPYTGRYLDLTCYPDPVDRLKIALARGGQGGGADYIQEGMLHYESEADLPLFQVHDELAWERPVDEPLDRIKTELCARMAQESRRFPGFACPVGVHEGKNWAEAKG